MPRMSVSSSGAVADSRPRPRAAPHLEPLLVGRDRADTGLQPIAHHQSGPAVVLAIANAELVHH